MTTDNEQTTLEPCPLLGHLPDKGEFPNGPYIAVSGEPGRPKFYAIVCPGCCSTSYSESKESVIKRWNARVSAASTAPVVDADLVDRALVLRELMRINCASSYCVCVPTAVERIRALSARAAASPAAPSQPAADKIWNACQEIVSRINMGEHNHPDLAHETALTCWLATIVAKHFETAPAAPQEDAEPLTFKNTKEAMEYAQRHGIPAVVPVSAPPSQRARDTAKELQSRGLLWSNQANVELGGEPFDEEAQIEEVAAIISRYFPATAESVGERDETLVDREEAARIADERSRQSGVFGDMASDAAAQATASVIADDIRALSPRLSTARSTLAQKVLGQIEATERFKNSYKDGERAAYGIAIDNCRAALRELFQREGIEIGQSPQT